MTTSNKLYLSNEELNELVGGVASSKAVSDDDIINLNAYIYCTCSYYDAGVIINDNQADGCTCGCILAC